MSHETPSLLAEKRERTGTRYSERLRRSGRLPAVVYGHGETPIAISVDETEVVRHLRLGQHVFEVQIDGGDATCLVKDLQFGYLGDNIIHVDFARVKLSEVVTVQVHIVWAGTPEEASAAGAVVSHDLTELSLRCTVRDIPGEIRVDLSAMDGTSMSAGEVELPENVELAISPETPIASISFIREEEAVGEEAEVDGGDQPSVIGDDAQAASEDE